MPELRLRSALHRRGYRFRVEFPIALESRLVRADIVFVRPRVAVFVDGCFWHRCPDHGTSPNSNSSYWQAKLDRNVARDVAVNEELSSAGWTVVRVWEHTAPEEAAGRIGRLIGRAGSASA